MASETILVVDDSPEILKFVSQYALAPLGYKVLMANDGVKGLEAALSSQPDLILLDMSMPRMTGLQVLAELRKAENQTPVIFMTMHGSENIAVEVFRLGVRDYLSKPFTIEELTTAVDKALHEERLMREQQELNRQLVAAETVRQMVVTLSHYLNNSLSVVQGGLEVLEDGMNSKSLELALGMQVIQDSKQSVKKIKTVMRVLQKLNSIEDKTYLGSLRMVDIEKALMEELAKAE
jgi:CheY-like chemotaxis protein